MNEKILVEGRYSLSIDLLKWLKISIVSAIVSALIAFPNLVMLMNSWGEEGSAALWYIGIVVFICSILVLIYCAVGYLYTRFTKITVSNRRVFGKAMGKQVDLPMDSISAVATTWLFKGIGVSTSSGKIIFFGIDNRDEIYSAINNLLIERQNNGGGVATSAPITNIMQETSVADELKKFKELLDTGVITQDEFDVKKKQLLGL